MIRRASIWTCFLVFYSVAPCFGAVYLNADVDEAVVGIDGRIKLHVTIEVDGQDQPRPELPPLSEFRVVSSGRTHHLSMVNGVARTSISYDYILTPLKIGRFTIGPVRLMVGNQQYTTKPIQVEVTRIGRSPAVQNDPKTQANPQAPTRRRVFITGTLDKDTAYVNEAVTYIFKFHRAERILSSPQYTRPTFPGFWVEELPPQKRYNTVIDGIRYEVTEIRTALFPTDAGQKTIIPARLKVTVERRNRQRTLFGEDLFGFFGGGEDLHLRTERLKLTVLPVPKSGKPTDWGGLVGRFELEAGADVREVNVGDPITVAVTVRGQGNIKSIPRPSIDSLPEFRTFSAGSSEEVSTANYRVSGTKTFDEVFVFPRPGKYIVPSFTLTYFDPEARSYRTVATDTIPVTVSGTAADFTIPSFRLNSDEQSDLANDVRFLKTDIDVLRRAEPPSIFGPSFWLGHLLPVLGLAGLVGWRRKVLREAADPAGRRRRMAYRVAIERLENSDGASPGALTIDGVGGALLGFYSDRYNCAVHGQRRTDMRENLRSDSLPGEIIEEYLSLLDACDRTRYAPGEAETGSAELAELVERARAVLARMDRRP